MKSPCRNYVVIIPLLSGLILFGCAAETDCRSVCGEQTATIAALQDEVNRLNQELDRALLHSGA